MLFYIFKNQIPKFKYPANATQSAYGICRYAAVFDVYLYDMIVLMIKYSKNNNHIKANKNHLKLKKTILQKKLNTRLIA